MHSIPTQSLTAQSGLAQFVGDPLDRLMTVEARPPRGGLPPGIVVPMYEICREYHGEPVSTLAARSLAETLEAGSGVLICTGAGVPPLLPMGETDGPPGAAALARALAIGFGANVTLSAEPAHAKAVSALASLVATETDRSGSVSFRPLPDDDDEDVASRLIGELAPSAVVFVELDGPNGEGRCHGVRGDQRPADTRNRLHKLAALAKERGVLTIGIGDGGNEVGFGTIAPALSLIHPNPSVITTVKVDCLVSCSVSNWGAYAVVSALAAHLGDARLVHSPSRELAFIATCLEAGARDGMDGKLRLAVDGIGWKGHMAVVELMSAIVAPHLSEPIRAPRPDRRDSAHQSTETKREETGP